MAEILIIDDEKKMCSILSSSLQDEGHFVDQSYTAEEALRKLKTNEYEIVITDLRLPDHSGLEILKACKLKNKDIQVILMTAHATAETAVHAMKEGAFDYLLKPFDLKELFDMVERIVRATAEKSNSTQGETKNPLGTIIGKSPEMIKVFKLVGQIAHRNVTVLIRGESGTGKELVANAIHNASPRSKNVLVTINCTALPEALFENELFGHEKEAFTGATSQKIGKFEAANGGTLFLDEIGDLSSVTQGKLLRVLEQKSFQRVGGNKSISVDVRIIAATNVDLETFVREKSFREDLFYRLNVFPIYLPALRERPDDIPLLAKNFLSQTSTDVQGFDDEAMALLIHYPWPGNVRQLENAIISSALRAKSQFIHAHNLPSEILKPQPNVDRPLTLTTHTSGTGTTSDPLDLASNEKRMIEEAIAKAGGNKTKAAQLLGITRRTLYSKLKILLKKECHD